MLVSNTEPGEGMGSIVIEADVGMVGGWRYCWSGREGFWWGKREAGKGPLMHEMSWSCKYTVPDTQVPIDSHLPSLFNLIHPHIKHLLDKPIKTINKVFSGRLRGNKSKQMNHSQITLTGGKLANWSNKLWNMQEESHLDANVYLQKKNQNRS